MNGGMIHRRDLAQKTISTSTPCADEAIRLVPDGALNMEQAIDFIANAEFVDVTPLGLRLRKKTLAANRRPGTRRCPLLGGTLSRQSRPKLFVSSGLAVVRTTGGALYCRAAGTPAGGWDGQQRKGIA